MAAAEGGEAAAGLAVRLVVAAAVEAAAALAAVPGAGAPAGAVPAGAGRPLRLLLALPAAESEWKQPAAIFKPRHSRGLRAGRG